MIDQCFAVKVFHGIGCVVIRVWNSKNCVCAKVLNYEIVGPNVSYKH